jgi:acyl carrier protein phosphodiesterase
MNYLAHIYLSGANWELKFGNFIADSVPGKQFNNYPEKIRKGILLHRAIDDFTDKHPIFREHTKLLFKDYGHYSRVIVDMYYDHFLAALWSQYHSQNLEDFTIEFYALIDKEFDLLPHKMKRAFPYMKTQNWLLQYKTISGLELILEQMEKRTKFDSNLKKSTSNLREDYDVFKNGFLLFFEDIQIFVSSKIESF